MSNLLAASLMGLYFVLAGVWFAWRSNKRKRELAAWSPVRFALHSLASSPRGSVCSAEDGATGSATRRATYERSGRDGQWLNPRGPLVGPASTTARESSPRFGSRAVPLNGR